MKYLFKTEVVLKGKWNKKYWIDNKIVHDIIVESENVKSAIYKYKDIVEKEYFFCISNHAMERKSAIYRDIENSAIQVGYCIIAKTDYIENVKAYCELWIEVFIIDRVKF